MPKRVDHHVRRTQIADALMRLAATEGLEAVSLRHVAAEAGASSGMVQHYFRTKDEMMVFAQEMVRDRVQMRMEALDWDDITPKGVVRAMLAQLLPLDQARTLEAHAALAFIAYAAVKPAIGAQLRADAERMREFLAERIRQAWARSTETRRGDPTQAATGLLALVDGLGIHVLGGQCSADAAVAALDSHLDELFDPR